MRIDNPKLISALPDLGIELRNGSALSELTSLGIGGTTDLLRIKKHEGIPDLLNLLDSNGVPHRFLGGGSNLLVGDGELPWVVVQLARPEPDVVLEGNLARVDAAYAAKYVDPGSGTPATIFVEDDHVYRVTPRLISAWCYATAATRTDWEP